MGEHVGTLGISLAFGLSIVAAAYGIGPISSAHLNPAVSFGMMAAGRMSGHDAAIYSIAQVAGATLAAAVILIIASGRADYSLATNGLGQNDYGAGYLGEYSMGAAFLFETVATFRFITVILGVTQNGAPTTLAGLAICLTLAGIHRFLGVFWPVLPTVWA
ncbi:aquaporin [Defluviimonas sp. WL0050]|uniref:Aquaporin n=1 Tax=Albidovulum litorale TaxID=2984134 RepID=A0ABT2ZPH9_9RHOB|nr:aquaporin [Defluviimonas sp. WL0050]MCV2872898.1 aquaporin [Defluviimonas sp. WL0050]